MNIKKIREGIEIVKGPPGLDARDALLLWFPGTAQFRVFMAKDLWGHWRTETFTSPELMAEMKDNPHIKEYLKDEFMSLLQRGIAELR